MPESQKPDMPLPADPRLRAPLEEAVLDGSTVTFRWEAAEDATDYLLEVASDTAFEHLVHSETTTATSATVADVFATDGTTYYWRVFTRNAAGESSGENIESFVSVTPEESHTPATQPGATPASKQHDVPEHPDREEDMGPVPEMLKAITAEVGAEVTGDDKYYEEEAELGVQHEGIGVGQVLGFMFATIVALGMAVVFVFFLTQTASQQALDDVTALQTYPQLREVEAAATQRLDQYEVLDAGAGVYQIPLDRAIDLMVNEAYQNPRTDYSSELVLRPVTNN